MSMLRYQPWGLNASLPGEVFKLFDQLSGAAEANPERSWQPRVDVLEFEDHYGISADLPGVSPEDVDISLENKLLTIAGRRELKTEPKDAQQHRRERQLGEFKRQFTLPDSADVENINARSEHGVLHITIPKRNQAQPVKISITH